jgi:hypothetical protein
MKTNKKSNIFCVDKKKMNIDIRKKIAKIANSYFNVLLYKIYLFLLTFHTCFDEFLDISKCLSLKKLNLHVFEIFSSS